MTINADDLIALFPSLYSRRDKGSSAAIKNRDWEALRVPRFRGIGPFWSFGMILDDQDGAVRRPRLDVLAEAGETIDLNATLGNLHKPLLLRTSLADLWSSRETRPSRARRSRLSVLAVDTFADGEEWPLPNDGSKSGFDNERSSALIFAPFGQFPKNEPSAFFMPAARLVSGEIWFTPQANYRPALLEALQLEEPGGEKDPKIALLPDGFGFKAGVRLPWIDEPLNAWIKVTTRPGVERDQPVLRLWRGRDPKLDDDWQRALDEFSQGFGKAKAGQDAPAWLSLATTERFAPELFFWPLEIREQVLLFRRKNKARSVSLEGRGFLAELGKGGPQIAVRPEVFEVGPGDDETLEITAHEEILVPVEDAEGLITLADPKPDGLTAIYRFHADGETLRLADRVGSEALSLAVPLLSNAARLREAMGFDEPRRASGDRQAPMPLVEEATEPEEGDDPDALRAVPGPKPAEPPSARLWLYTPLRNGWLHWPFPNATNEFLTFISENDGSDPPTRVERAVTSGLWRMQNVSGDLERAWALSLFNGMSVDLSLALARDGPLWKVKTADITLGGLSARFDGVLPVTAFAQRPERFLPEAADRALRASALTAVTPDTLVGEDDRLWRLDAEGMRVVVRLAGDGEALTLHPTSDGRRVGFRAGHRLELKVHWPTAAVDAESLFQPRGSEDSLPWLWQSHKVLGTVQTLPLAAAGEATNAPSGNREFAPLRRVQPNRVGPEVLDLRFSEPLEMTHSAVTYDPGEHLYQRPGATLPWDNEVGQAITTLPSVTLFVGGVVGKSLRLSDESWGDATLLNTSGEALAADIRYDIALADESFALATLPPPDPDPEAATGERGAASAAETGTMGAVFRPGPWNAPGGDTPDSAWFPVWVERSRQLALAAVYDRRMIAGESGGPGRLKNLFAETDYPLEKVSLEIGLGLSEPEGEYEGDETGVRLDYAGRMSLEFIGSLGMGTIELNGLPSAGDLMGIAGQFPRSEDHRAEVQLGTMQGDALIGGLWDQAGWKLAYQPQEPAAESVRFRKATREATEIAGGDVKVRGLDQIFLGSLRNTLDVRVGSDAAAPPLRLYFRDVPFGSTPGAGAQLTADLRDAFSQSETGWDRAANGLSPDLNHRLGFAWSLSQEGAGGHVLFGPFAFEPLAMIGALIADGTGRLEEARFEGRIKLVVPRPSDMGGDTGLAFLEGTGSATLTIARDVYGVLTASCAVPELDLPLSDSQAEDRFVARFRASEIVLGEGASSIEGQLVFPVGEAEVAVDVTADMARVATASTPSLVKAELGRLTVGEARLRLPPVNWAGTLSVDPVTASVGISTAFGAEKGRYVIRERYNLIEPGLMAEHSGSILQISGQELALSPTLTTRRDDDPLSDRMLAFNWQLPVGILPTPFCGAFDVLGGEGAALLLLGEYMSDGFKVTSVTHRARLSVSGEGATLELVYPSFDDRSETPSRVMLSGRLEVRNLHRFAKMDVTVDGAYLTATLNSAAPTFQHDLVARIEGAPVTLEDLHEGWLRLSAAVNHELSDAAGTDAKWTSHQLITLFSDRGLKGILTALLTQPGESVLTHAGTLGVDVTVKAHVVRSWAAMPYGLNKAQAEAVLAWLEADGGRRCFLEASAHHVLRPTGEAAPLNHLPLPAIGAFQDPAADIPPPFDTLVNITDDVKLRRSSRPGDGIELPPLDPAVAARIDARLAEARQEARADRIDLASALWKRRSEPRPRALFQGQTEAEVDAAWTWSDPEEFLGTADVSLRLSYWKTEGPVTAYTLAPGTWRDADFVSKELVGKTRSQDTIKTTAAYFKAWEMLGSPAQHLVPGSDDRGAASNHKDPAVGVSVRAASRDNSEITEIARIVLPVRALFDDPAQDGDDDGGAGISIRALEMARAKIGKWARDILAREAPWADVALVEADRLVGTAPFPLVIMSVDSSSPAQRRVRRAARAYRKGARPQHQRLAHPPRPAALTAGAAEGYLPFRAGSEILTDAFGALRLEGQTEVALTATAAVSGFGLGATAQRVVPAERLGTHQGFWISDRETIVPRPFEALPYLEADTVGVEITFALPPDPATGFPVALAPAASSGLYPKADPKAGSSPHRTYHLPPLQIQSQIGVRSGAWNTRRIGIDEVEADSTGGLAVTPAPQAPLIQRTPRPVELGVNDRTRASAFEPRHFDLASEPMAILHDRGQRITDPPDEEEPDPGGFGGEGETAVFLDAALKAGLDRRPRGRGALIVKLKAPKFALLGPDWQGEITLTRVAGFGAPPPDWSVKSAIIQVGENLYLGQGDGSLTGGDGTIQLVGFRKGGRSLLTDLLDLPGATPLTLRVLLSAPGIERQLVFGLYKTGGEAPLVDRAAFLRFDDPAYNDRLTGLPKLDRVPIPGTTGTELVFLGERNEVTPGDYLTLAAALVSTVPGNNPEAEFFALEEEIDKQIVRVLRLRRISGGAPIPMAIRAERRRPGTNTAVQLDLIPPDPNAEADFAIMSQSLYLYKIKNVDENLGERPLIAGDRLSIRLELGEGEAKEQAILRFDVVEKPRFPSNPAAFAFKSFLWEDKKHGAAADNLRRQLSVPLYARLAEPSVIELVDPRDMLRGIVRRRAIYYWRDFLQPSADGLNCRFALMKSGRTGATWLPNSIDDDWALLDSPSVQTSRSTD
ncbi:hypothetical protein [Mesorhizobium sp. WSM2239]|uniref:Uncharacterized protein n=2 Tax=unclassified Mesorhizobium TaxID=325217 RepID=A0AAU8DHM2_9HYPH